MGSPIANPRKTARVRELSVLILLTTKKTQIAGKIKTIVTNDKTLLISLAF